MSETTEDLGRRAVACKHWRWMRGMFTNTGFLIESEPHGRTMGKLGRTPDLTDPATLGCLLALVREAWGESWVHTRRYNSEWECAVGMPGNKSFFGATEAEALVAALEAAP